MSGEPTKRILPRTGYPRRRAVTACEVCRERKKRCDNSRPSCSFCQSIGIRCEYRGRDEASFDPSSLAILDRLSVLESLMRQHNCASNSAAAPSLQSQQSPAAGVTPSADTATQHAQSSPAANLWELHTGADSRVRLDTILQWPIFERPLSSLRRYPFLTFRKERDYTYLQDMFHTTETIPSGPTTATPLSISTDRTEVERLIDRFFILVHVKNPILDRQVVKQYCQEYCENGPAFNLRSCLILLICALGSAAPEFYPSSPLGPNHGCSRSRAIGGENVDMAQCYFAAAEKRLGAAMPQHNSLAVQCLCLAGIYHMCLVNPIAGHAMFHNAGYIMQMLASTGQNPLEESSQIGSSLYWACFKSEREIFAEIPIAIPALGRPSEASSYPLPPQERFMWWAGTHTTNANNQKWAQVDEDSWYFFLSEIAMRRIVDEVSDLVGNFFQSINLNSALPSSPSPSQSQSPSVSTSSNITTLLEDFTPITTEFERQALSWRSHLPPSISFPDVPQPAPSEWMLYSRSPFYRTLELMHRPFIFAYVHGLARGPGVQALAAKGLRYAQQYLKGCHPTHAHHGRAIQLRHELRMVAILFAACGSGLEMPRGWYEDVRAMLRALVYWMPVAPYLRSYVDVVLAFDESFKRGDAECTGTLRQEIEMGL